MLKIISILFASLLCGTLGRLGGMGDDFWVKHQNFPRWIFQSWVRDWLLGPLCVAIAFLLGAHNWWILLAVPLTGAALSTYWDWLFKYDNYWVHGLFVGIAAAPIAYATGHWWFFLLRCVLLAVWMGAWSLIIFDDNLEEFGRYAPVGGTIFLLC